MGYTLSAFVSYLFREADTVSGLLTVPSILGEVWIAGYLIVIGIRPRAPAHGRKDGRE